MWVMLGLILSCDDAVLEAEVASEEDSGPLSVAIQTTCLDGACSAVELAPVSDDALVSWAWSVVRGDEVTIAETESVELSLSEGVSMITLKVEAEDEREASDTIGLSVMPVVFDDENDADGLAKVTILGLGQGSCDSIPVVSVGGCLTGPFAMFFDLMLGGTPETVTFDRLSEVFTSTQPDAHATWSLGTGIVGFAPGTTPSEYGPGTVYTPPPIGGEHFTFFFDAPYGATSIITPGHHDQLSEALAFTGHDITVACNEHGGVIAVAHQER